MGSRNPCPKRKIDMSPEAVDARLDMVNAFYDRGKYLQTV
jgi:hypothetical protein